MATNKRYEIKIGLLAIISIVVLFLGFNFLKGSSIFDNSKEFVSYWENVGGLNVGAKVQLQGYQIGRVEEIELMSDRRFKVTYSINDEFKISKDSKVTMLSNDILSGSKIVDVVVGTSPDLAQDGDELPTFKNTGLLESITSGSGPIVDNVGNVVKNADTLLGNFNKIVDDETQRNLKSSIAALDLTMQNLTELSKVIAAQSKAITSIVQNADGTMKYANSFVTNLNNNNAKIEQILSNTQNATAQLSNAKIQETLDNLQSTTKNLDRVISKLDTKEGSLGLLVNDPALYNNLNQSLKQLDFLLDDLKKNPSRYINVSVFGK